MTLPPDRIDSVLDGTWLAAPPPGWSPSGVCFQAKFAGPGDLVVAPSARSWGEGVDDLHDRLPALAARGVAGAIVECPPAQLPADFPVLHVADTRAALTALADAGRAAFRGTMLAVTGSVGKSSVREMLRHVLDRQGGAAATRQNYNLVAGVELSLAQTPPNAAYGVYEIAIGKPGTLVRSARRVAPQVAVVTAIAPVHLKGYGSLDTIARTKAQIFDGLEPGRGIAVLNADDPWFEVLAAEARGRDVHRIVSFGTHAHADVCLSSYRPDAQGADAAIHVDGRTLALRLPQPGQHLAMNSAAVIAASWAAGADIEQVARDLGSIARLPGRTDIQTVAYGDGTITLIDDSFNANPASMRAAFEVLENTPPAASGRRVAMLADMLDLGPDSPAHHRELAEPLTRSGVERVLVAGTQMVNLLERLPDGLRGGRAESVDTLLPRLGHQIRAGDVVLVKGSHHTGISRVAEALKRGNVVPARAPAANQPAADTPQPNRPHTGVAAELETGAVVLARAAERLVDPGGLTCLMTLYCAFSDLAAGHLDWDAAAPPPDADASADATPTVADAVAALAATGAAPAARALALGMAGDERRFVLRMTETARGLGLQRTIFRTATGRPAPGQVSTAADLTALARRLARDFPDHLPRFAATRAEFAGRTHTAEHAAPDSDGTTTLLHSSWTRSAGRTSAVIAHDTQPAVVMVVAGAATADGLGTDLDRVREAASAAARPARAPTLPARAGVRVDSPWRASLPPKPRHQLLFLGDTYFGEHYDARRERQGAVNVLKTAGYTHALAHFAPFLADADASFANLEAAVTTATSSPLTESKGWVLGAEPGPTLQTLDAYGVTGCVLGNNHAADFGWARVPEMLDHLDERGFLRCGAGRDAAEAATPLRLACPFGDQTGVEVLIFSAYQRNRTYAETYGFYADDATAGVADLDSETFHRSIRDHRRDNPGAFIVVQPHWGRNYAWRSTNQQRQAERLIDAGADLIVGHGAHMLQEIEYIDGRWCAYSIGNAVFNNNGEHDKRGVPPVSFTAVLDIHFQDGMLYFFLRLYPIFCHNHKTKFQPRPLSEQEFAEFWKIVSQRMPHVDPASPFVQTALDDRGHHIALLLRAVPAKTASHTPAGEARSA